MFTRPRSTKCSYEAKRMLLLVPVYPAEASIRMIARSTDGDEDRIIKLLKNLPAEIPVAERSEKFATYLTFPSIEDKRRAIGEAFVV